MIKGSFGNFSGVWGKKVQPFSLLQFVVWMCKISNVFWHNLGIFSYPGLFAPKLKRQSHPKQLFNIIMLYKSKIQVYVQAEIM